jgi:hypothetical protein
MPRRVERLLRREFWSFDFPLTSAQRPWEDAHGTGSHTPVVYVLTLDTWSRSCTSSAAPSPYSLLCRLCCFWLLQRTPT